LDSSNSVRFGNLARLLCTSRVAFTNGGVPRRSRHTSFPRATTPACRYASRRSPAI
jgi:hypothetical protein